jgi:hypothetical protein
MFQRISARMLVSLAATLSLSAACSRAEKSEPAAGGHPHYASTGPDKPNADGQIAPRLQNLGAYTFPVSTKNEEAQKFINQGLNLSYAFNHAESGRAFREAARLDPNLAMAYWGQALVLGPNINAAMEPTDEAPAYEAINKAVALKSGTTPQESSLIDALAARYTGKPEDRVARDRAYSDAMKKVAEQFPDDLDVQVLYVESVMDLRPWGYWMRDGAPHEGIADAVDRIERVLARKDNHPGALHLYIHLMEADDTRIRSRATSSRSPPTRTTSASAARRVCIRWVTTRITCTSSGSRRPSTAKVRRRSMRRERPRPRWMMRR